MYFWLKNIFNGLLSYNRNDSSGSWKSQIVQRQVGSKLCVSWLLITAHFKNIADLHIAKWYQASSYYWYIMMQAKLNIVYLWKQWWYDFASSTSTLKRVLVGILVIEPRQTLKLTLFCFFCNLKQQITCLSFKSKIVSKHFVWTAKHVGQPY